MTLELLLIGVNMVREFIHKDKFHPHQFYIPTSKQRSEAKPTITSQEGASYSPPFDKFVEPPRERGGFVKVGDIPKSV